jgi:VWFA-related protein
VIRFSDETSVSWVLVPVVARDGGRYKKGLRAGDFRLRVDGRAVEIESFDSGLDAPLSLVHLQDLSGSMANGGKLEASREALRFFLAQMRDQDRLAVASFASGRTQVEVPFTDRKPVIEEALEAWEGYGTTALHDAVALLPEIHLGGHLKGAAVLLTDGVDNASVLSPARARELVRRAEIPVYVLALGDRRGDPRPTAPAAGSGARERPVYSTVLRQLAAATAGRYYSIRDSGVRAACAAIVAELRHQYVLGFPTSARGPVEDHQLWVEVPGKRLRISHRLGYRGSSPAAHRSPIDKEKL